MCDIINPRTGKVIIVCLAVVSGKCFDVCLNCVKRYCTFSESLRKKGRGENCCASVI